MLFKSLLKKSLVLVFIFVPLLHSLYGKGYYTIELDNNFSEPVPKGCKSEYDVGCYKCLYVDDVLVLSQVLKKIGKEKLCDLTESEILALFEAYSGTKPAYEAAYAIFSYTTYLLIENKTLNSQILKDKDRKFKTVLMGPRHEMQIP